ncbi:MAG: alginate export family protein [Gammaproteobacteria bacterium]|nr:alginate export family protein [Gammaproteobacteria bacterium]
MKIRKKITLICLFSGLLAISFQSLADDVLGFEQQIEDALKIGGGKINIDVNWRFEYVDDSTNRKEGFGDPFRIRIGYLTPEFHGLTAFAEYEGVQTVFASKYNNLVNQNNTSRGVVADPERHEVNRLWVQYAGIPDTKLKVGRQRIKLDNDRFIGNVGWRQLEQTYDSVRLTNTTLPDTTFDFAYIWKQRDIFSKNVNMDTFITNISYTGFEYGKLAAYAYLLDYDDAADSLRFRRANHTYGLYFQGKAPLAENLKLVYKAEYAHQWDFQKNPVSYSTDYFNGELGFDIHGVTVKGGIEQLSADNGIGFQTPLSTLHAFNGWADLFLATPPDGLQDIYVSVSTVVKGVKLLGVFHNFTDDNHNIDYGHEFNALALKKFGKHYSVLVKYAHYEADEFRTDTDRFWLQLGMSF